MGQRIEKEELQQAATFINSICGVPKYLIVFILRCYMTYCLMELYQGKNLHFALIGKISFKKGMRTKPMFTPSARLRKFLYMNRLVDVNAVIESYKRYLNANMRSKDINDYYMSNTPEELKKIVSKTKTRDYYKQLQSVDLVRASLLQYLQREFPYEVEWRHPANGNIYPYKRIESKVKMYRYLDPEGYELLYSLWLNVGEKNTLTSLTNFTETLIPEKMDRMLDSLVLMIVHPDLEPEALESMCRMGILSLSV